MKKWMIILLALAMLPALSACSKSGGGDAAPPESQQPSAAQPEEPETPAVPAAPDSSPEQPGELLPDPDKDEGGGIADVGEDGVIAGAGEDSSAPVIYVSHTDVTLRTEGDTFRLTVWDSNGREPEACTYTSAAPEVASVDEAGGEVTAVAPGATTVTAHAVFDGEQHDFDCIVRCKWDAAETPEPSVPASGGTERPALDEFFAGLQERYDGLDAMMVLDGELLDNYYPGLSDIAAVEEVLIQETMVSISNVAVGLVKLSDDASLDDVVAVQNILQGRITAQAEGGAWYPASCETWGSGVITSVSNVVGMFVYPDGAQAMADLFTETFTN